jgi:hypothetical protein
MTSLVLGEEDRQRRTWPAGVASIFLAPGRVLTAPDVHSRRATTP